MSNILPEDSEDIFKHVRTGQWVSYIFLSAWKESKLLSKTTDRINRE